MKYRRFTPSGSKDIRIRKFEFVTKTQFGSSEPLSKDGNAQFPTEFIKTVEATNVFISESFSVASYKQKMLKSLSQKTRK